MRLALLKKKKNHKPPYINQKKKRPTIHSCITSIPTTKDFPIQLHVNTNTISKKAPQ
jgi:hypothetical protein